MGELDLSEQSSEIELGVLSDMVWNLSAFILVHNPMAVLMAVRFELSCFLLRDIAAIVVAISNSLQTI
jgi:hypothetical protein